MNIRTKTAAGASAGVVLITVVIWLFHIVQEVNELRKMPFENAGTFIVVTDSLTGKKDTMLLRGYMERQKYKLPAK